MQAEALLPPSHPPVPRARHIVLFAMFSKPFAFMVTDSSLTPPPPPFPAKLRCLAKKTSWWILYWSRSSVGVLLSVGNTWELLHHVYIMDFIHPLLRWHKALGQYQARIGRDVSKGWKMLCCSHYLLCLDEARLRSHSVVSRLICSKRRNIRCCVVCELVNCAILWNKYMTTLYI